jgi:hypothetical protein
MYLIQRGDGQYYASQVTEPLPIPFYWSPLKSKATQFTNYYQADAVQSKCRKIDDNQYTVIDLVKESL